MARDIAGLSSQLTARAPTLPTIGGTSSGPAVSMIACSCVGDSCGASGSVRRLGFGIGDSSYTALNEGRLRRTFCGGTSSGPALAMISSSSSGVSAGTTGVSASGGGRRGGGGGGWRRGAGLLANSGFGRGGGVGVCSCDILASTAAS